MKLRTVGKLGVILSVILFCIGVGLYSFARLSAYSGGYPFSISGDIRSVPS